MLNSTKDNVDVDIDQDCYHLFEYTPVKHDDQLHPLDLSNKTELQEDTEAALESINPQPAESLELKSLKEEIIRLD